MDPAKDEQEECQSSSESGWTMYLGSPVKDQQSYTFNSQQDVDGNYDGYHHAHDDDDDDSEASDASSGPSNYHHPWIKGEGRVNHGSKHAHEEEQRPSDEEKTKKKARAHSEQHVVAKKKGVLGDGRRKNQHQTPQKASSHAR